MRVGVLTVAALALCASQSWATELRSEGGFIWDFYDDSDAALINGSIDAYDTAYWLEVNGTRYYSRGPGTFNMDGRGVKTSEIQVGDLYIRRHIYVPKSGGDYARFLDIITNPGLTEQHATVRIGGNLGSDSSTVLVNTASGDAILDATDFWFSTDDTDGTGDPSLGHLVQGPDGSVVADDISLSMDEFSWSFSVTVPAEGRAVVLTVAIQEGNQREAQSEASRLILLPPDLLQGLGSYRDDIVNF